MNRACALSAMVRATGCRRRLTSWLSKPSFDFRVIELPYYFTVTTPCEHDFGDNTDKTVLQLCRQFCILADYTHAMWPLFKRFQKMEDFSQISLWIQYFKSCSSCKCSSILDGATKSKLDQGPKTWAQNERCKFWFG